MAKKVNPTPSLIDIPYVGKATLKDFQQLGIHTIEDLKNKNARKLYQQLCALSGKNSDLVVDLDPCVEDVFACAIHYAQTEESFPWWHFSRKRKEREQTEKIS